MTQDEIIRMAWEAGFDNASGIYYGELERFAALVAAHEKKFWMAQIEVECNEAVLAEREACAKVCEEIAPWGNSADDWAASCLNKSAKAIRARNNND